MSGVGSKRAAEDAGEPMPTIRLTEPTIRLKMKLPTRREQDELGDEEAEDAGGDSDGIEDEEEKDWTDLEAKADHSSRPLYVGKNKHCFLERFSPFFKYSEDFMIAISEPVSRCQYMNEYVLTQHSLHAAVSIGLTSETIITRLNMLCKTVLPATIQDFIRRCTEVYGKVKMVIVDDRFFLETPRRDIFERLSRDPEITSAKTGNQGQSLLSSHSTSGALPDGASRGRSGHGAGVPGGRHRVCRHEPLEAS